MLVEISDKTLGHLRQFEEMDKIKVFPSESEWSKTKMKAVFVSQCLADDVKHSKKMSEMENKYAQEQRDTHNTLGAGE